MSQFDQNPFDEDSDRNPYSQSGRGGESAGSFFDNVARGFSGNSRPTPLPPESRSGSTFDAAADVQFSPRALRKKQKEIQSREAALRRKEEEIARREACEFLEPSS
eukprot:TRINITY_DN18467_c0_g1_i1.p1 TRINITY_DN18467_c0_g1~~TRINITY_DN18467_c0_g1_i1.p1  ORF type:complete len:106 (-),score=15.37 TRINITY_DN18467_c0_g1_i1:40-357(-)